MTKLSHRVQFFLGANSAEGFASLYGQWIDQADAQAFYVLKGGAGCGKSTLMRQTARRMEAEGCAVEYIRCSGDPDSLDGIFIPRKGAGIMDGTAPHTIDPAFPGATGHYVDLGAGYKKEALFLIREEIVAAVRAYKECYPPAYRCIRGAEESRRRGCRRLHTEKALAKAEKQAEDILSRELSFSRKHRTGPGKQSRRFLGGCTCQGRIFLEDTVLALSERGYTIQDECGLSGVLLSHLEKGFLENGYDVIACPCPEQPRRLEHLLIPERSLAFVTNNIEAGDFQTIDTENFVEEDTWQESRSFLRLSNRVAEELLEDAMEHLLQAKEKHDRLEELYHAHVDFSKADAMADQITEEILNLPDRER